MRKIRALIYVGIFFSILNLLTIPRITTDGNIAQTYLGPKKFGLESADLIRVEILVKDSPLLSGLQIQNVVFNGQIVPLKPRDVFGKRGDASFQLPPGKYILKWTANRDSLIWPRVLKFEEEVILDPRDLWIQVQIEGDQASIR
ncbi:MAG TPA: hypothetical protein VLE96_06590 [Chlamydiales bacterium]|nr:hypothetical protein [Chlamydiales bacterium]